MFGGPCLLVEKSAGLVERGVWIDAGAACRKDSAQLLNRRSNARDPPEKTLRRGGGIFG